MKNEGVYDWIKSHLEDRELDSINTFLKDCLEYTEETERVQKCYGNRGKRFRTVHDNVL